ncbi:MAG: HlyD family efflux transporter periplasmic adaptor subunit [Bacteroidia bacterium]
MRTLNLKIFIFLFLTGLFYACGNNIDSQDPGNEVSPTTPVTVSNVSFGPIKETIELNAITSFQMKISVKATVTGYLQQVNTAIGNFVNNNQVLFEIKTAEATALAHSGIDTLFNFSGLIKIKSQQSGIVNILTHQKGDYVQQGDELAVISDRNSLVFLVQVPFEMNGFIKTGMDCEVILPGDSILKGKIIGSLPQVDAISQTQQYVLKVPGNSTLPENLIAKVRLIKSIRQNATIIPREALLSNETQTEFWVMKLLNDSVAIKVPVIRGIEAEDKIEIVEPELKSSDRILITGNYGLADTANVSLQLKE